MRLIFSLKIANEIFKLNMKPAGANALDFVHQKFETFLNDQSKDPEILSAYVDFDDIVSDDQDAPWAEFAQQNYIDPHLLRVTTLLLIAIGRINARKSFVDDNILRFYVNFKRDLAMYLRYQEKNQSLSAKDAALVQYLAKSMAISRLAEYEDSLPEHDKDLTGEHTVTELRDMLL